MIAWGESYRMDEVESFGLTKFVIDDEKGTTQYIGVVFLRDGSAMPPVRFSDLELVACFLVECPNAHIAFGSPAERDEIQPKLALAIELTTAQIH